MSIKVLTFDIEIQNCIQGKGEEKDPQYNYCGGWNDQAGMGISFLGAHRSWDQQIEFFDEKNLHKFPLLIKDADVVTGYNIFGFDTGVYKATMTRLGKDPETGMKWKCYDPFNDIKKALRDRFPKGWTLENVATSTLGYGKNGDGAEAPRMWQRGEIADLINYLAQDCRVEAALFQFILENGYVNNISKEVNVIELQLPNIRKWQEFAASLF